MKVIEFIKKIAAKSSNRTTIDAQQHSIVDKINEGLLELANITTPLNLRVKYTEGYIYRRLSKTRGLRKPKEVKTLYNDIDLDKDLLDALAYNIIAKLEPQRGAYYRGMMMKQITYYEQRLIEYEDVDREETLNDWQEQFGG